MPKVGDKVKATLGENVLVGTVRELSGDFDPRSTFVTIDVPEAGNDYLYIYAADGWQFEQVVSLPSKPWALVGHPTDYDYVPYLRDRVGDWHEVGPEGHALPVDEETVRHYLGRGFTILFDGVDE